MLLCTYSTSVSFAQTKIDSGIITDSPGTPLSQAIVKAKAGKASVLMNSSGYFKLIIPKITKFLTVSYVGMTSQDDTRMQVAISTIDQFVHYVMNTPAEGLRSAASIKAIYEIIERNKLLNEKHC